MRFKLIKYNFHQLLIAFDQLLRCVLGLIISLINGHSKSYADETLSAYAYRKSLNNGYAKVLMYMIDFLLLPFEGFKLGHCERSFYNEKHKKHLPSDYK